MSELIAECGCEMVQSGAIRGEPLYDIRFCDTHNPRQIRERCAKVVLGNLSEDNANVCDCHACAECALRATAKQIRNLAIHK